MHCGISIRGLLPDIGKNSSHIVGLLERGIAVRQGQRFLRMELPRILATPPDVLSPRMVRVIEELASDWRRLDERIKGLSGEIEELAKRDAGCERLMSVPGIGPIIEPPWSPRSEPARGSPRVATSPPGCDSCPSRSRPEPRYLPARRCREEPTGKCEPLISSTRRREGVSRGRTPIGPAVLI